MVHSISFRALGSHWPIVIAVAVGTLVISVAGGALLGLHRDISPLTGGLALVAGGSSESSPSPANSVVTTVSSRPSSICASH